MTKRKTTSELIAELDMKESQIHERIKALKQRKREEERKARTHRLIEIGAEVESVLGRSIEKEDIPKLIDFLETQERRGNFFSKAMEKTREQNSETESEGVPFS